MDILFTKEEQSRSLLFASKKSPEPALEREHMDKLLGEYNSQLRVDVMIDLGPFFTHRIYGQVVWI